MLDKNLFEKVGKKIEELRPGMIDFQKKITAIPAISPESGGEGEWDKAMFIKDFLQKNGFTEIEQVDAPDPKAKNGKRPNLVVRIPGESADRTIWIMAHTDVVPEGDRKKWDTDPFTVVERDGKIFGRGTEDNQQSLTSGLFTAIALKELDIKPLYNLNILLVADEETGSEFGLSYMLKHHRDWFRKEDIILVPDSGLPDATQIEIAEKGIIWLKFTTRGKQCHASLPGMGINAFKAASKLVVKLQDLYKIFDAKNDVFEPATSTFEPTKKEANVPNVNTIPGEDVFYFDCRLLPEYSVDQLLKEVRKMCEEVEKEYGVKIEVETMQRENAATVPPPIPIGFASTL